MTLDHGMMVRIRLPKLYRKEKIMNEYEVFKLVLSLVGSVVTIWLFWYFRTRKGQVK